MGGEVSADGDILPAVEQNKTWELGSPRGAAQEQMGWEQGIGEGRDLGKTVWGENNQRTTGRLGHCFFISMATHFR